MVMIVVRVGIELELANPDTSRLANSLVNVLICDEALPSRTVTSQIATDFQGPSPIVGNGVRESENSVTILAADTHVGQEHVRPELPLEHL